MALRTPAFNDAKNYPFAWLRAMLESTPVQEGVIASGDMKVTAAAGGGMKVDIAAGTALVKGDSGTPATGLSQGLFLQVNDASVANAVTLAASHATLPRIDQIVLRIDESQNLLSGADDAVFDVITGVATSGATLDNRTGAVALGNDKIRLSDILVPAASSVVSAGNIRDRRQWARGASSLLTVTSGNLSGLGSTTLAEISSNFRQRVELSGVPLRVTFSPGYVQASAPVTPSIEFMLWIDGAAGGARKYGQATNSANIFNGNPFVHLLGTPAPGSRLISEGYVAAGSGSWGIGADGTRATDMLVEELVRQNANNN